MTKAQNKWIKAKQGKTEVLCRGDKQSIMQGKDSIQTNSTACVYKYIMAFEVRYDGKICHIDQESECPRSPLLRPASLEGQLSDSEDSSQMVLSPQKSSIADLIALQEPPQKKTVQKRSLLEFLEAKSLIKSYQMITQ